MANLIKTRVLLVCLLLLVSVPLTVLSQQLMTPDVTPQTEQPEPPPPLLDNPRRAVKRLLDWLEEGTPDNADALFDNRYNRYYTYNMQLKVAEVFSSMLDEYGRLLPANIVSDSPEGSEESGLGIHFEKVGEFKVDGEAIPLLLERINYRGEYVWVISRNTVTTVYQNLPEHHTARIMQWLPEPLKENTWRGAPVGQWISAPIVAVLSYAMSWLLTFGVRQVVRRFTRLGAAELVKAVSHIFLRPANLVIAVAFYVVIARYIDMSILVRQDVAILTIAVLWIAFFIFLWSLIDFVAQRSEMYLREKNRVGGLSILIFLRATLKVIVIFLALIALLDSSGVDVSTGLAALGIGGIALALGAQKAIENLVGSIIIITDQPLRVGDFCKIGDMLGSVEHIGIRSTRIRTLDDTVVTIPNGMLSGETIENFTKRRKFLVRTTLNLRYETQPDDLRALIDGMKAQLLSFDFVSPAPARVRFAGYGASSLDVEVFAYIFAPDYEAFLERKETLLMSFMPLVEQHNSGFAFPSSTVYLGKDDFGQSTAEPLA